MTLFASWMIPAFISLVLLVWFVAGAIRAPMSSIGVNSMMARLEATVQTLFIIWALYGLFCLGMWIAGFFG